MAINSSLSSPVIERCRSSAVVGAASPRVRSRTPLGKQSTRSVCLRHPVRVPREVLPPLLTVPQPGGTASSKGRIIAGAGVTSGLKIPCNASSNVCAMTIRFS